MSNILLYIKDETFNVASYKIENDIFNIDIEKGTKTLSKIKEFLEDKNYFDVQIDDKENETGYGFSSEHYKPNIIEEKENTFHLQFVYCSPEKSQLNKMEELEAKLDYLAIMTDIDLEEV